MYEWLLDIIGSIENGRRDNKQYPVCATFAEVSIMCTVEQRRLLRDSLNTLYSDGKIIVWSGINDTIIQRKHGI